MLFLHHLTLLGFLPPSIEANTFIGFPVMRRRIIAAEVVEQLLFENPYMSASNVRTILEVLGQALALPIEDKDIIQKVTQLYRKWLLADKSSSPLQSDEVLFTTDIIQQLSLVFEQRTSTLVDVHTELCVEVLRIFLELARTHRLRNVWEEAVKVLLGVTDYLLREDMEGIPNPMWLIGDKICSKILAVFFEVLFRSELKNHNIWTKLSQLVIKWRHRMPLIHQWAQITWTLTGMVLHIMYGPSYGNERFMMEGWDENMINLEISEDFVFYSWHRMLYLLGDLETITESNNYFQAMRDIGRITDLLLSVTSKEYDHPVMDGNTILHVVGDWLFKAIENFHEYNFDSGKAEAIQILMRIFESKRDTQFLPAYLACFYFGLEKGLVKNNFLLGVIITCTKSIFQLELTGSHVLIPIYAQSLEYVLSSKTPPLARLSVGQTELRSACVRLLGYMLCLQNHYAHLGSFLTDEKKIDPNNRKVVTTFKEINVMLPAVILDLLRNESEPEILIGLMWNGFVFVIENFKDSIMFAEQFLNLLLNRITSPPTTGWPLTVTISALKALSCFAEYQSKLLEPSDTCKDLVNLPIKIVSDLSRLIESLCVPKESWSADLDHIIIASFDTILSWIMNDHKFLWVHQDPKSMHVVFQALQIAMYGKRESYVLKDSKEAQKHVPPSPKVKEHAEVILEQITGKLGIFPTTLGASLVSNPICEAEYIQKHNLTLKHASCYVAGNTIMTLLRHPRKADESSIRIGVFLRSICGKFVWEASVNYAPADLAPVLGREDEIESKIYNPVTEEKVDSHILQSMSSMFNEKQKEQFEFIKKMAVKQEAKKIENLKRTHYGLQIPSQALSPPKPYLDMLGNFQEFNSVRLFLSHLGHISHPPPLIFEKMAHTAAHLVVPTPPRPRNNSHAAANQAVSSAPSPSPLKNSLATSSNSVAPTATTSISINTTNAATHVSISSNNSNNVGQGFTFGSGGARGSASEGGGNVGFHKVELFDSMYVFEHHFGPLDHVKERECFEVSVVFVPEKSNFSDEEIYDREEGSPDYNDFLHAVGWQVKNNTHRGYNGSLFDGVPRDHDEATIYYANYAVEMIYRVSTLLSKSRRNFLFLLPVTPRARTEDEIQYKIGEMSTDSSTYKQSPANSPELTPISKTEDTGNANSTGGRNSPKRRSSGSNYAIKKSMSVSGIQLPPKEQTGANYVLLSARSASSQSFIRALADDEGNVCSVSFRKKLLVNTKVLIVWSDTLQSKQHYNISQLIGSRALISIVIYPLRNGLFHVKIFKKPSVLLGPLADDMVVNKFNLGPLVRQTAVNACLALNDPDVIKPYAQRKNIIQDFIKATRLDATFTQFYAPHFQSA